MKQFCVIMEYHDQQRRKIAMCLSVVVWAENREKAIVNAVERLASVDAFVVGDYTVDIEEV